MRIGTSYKQHRDLDERWDAIVIGSGMGGLTVAATLSRVAKKRVLVLERHYTAGGFTHTFRRPGYEWDVGVHYIGEVNREGGGLRRAFDFLSDGQLHWADMGPVYDRIIVADRSYDFVAGREAFREKMQGYFPSEKAAIDGYLERIEQAVKTSQRFFAEKAMPSPISSVFGGMMRRPLLKEARRTTRSVLEELTSNQELIGVLTGQWGDYGLPPAQSSFFIHAAVARHYLEGAAYPVGGSSEIARTILPGIEASGGELVTNAEVEEILIEQNEVTGVRLFDGRALRAPMVISDAGAANTYGRLLRSGYPARKRVESKLQRVTSSTAHLCLYVGLDGTAEELGLSKTNLWVYNSPDHERELQRFLQDPSAPFPLAYLSFPSAKDPSFEQRHPGHSTIEVLTVGPYDWFERWQSTSWKKRGEAYEAFKLGFEERLLEVLYTHCPSTRGKVEISELSTPLSTRNFAGHPHGEIYGLSHVPDRFEQRWLRPRSPIQGLYLTGADVCTAGVAGALMGGVLSSTAILGPKVMKEVFARRGASAPKASV
jgi:all-trans-retinol 13,14-reductase